MADGGQCEGNKMRKLTLMTRSSSPQYLLRGTALRTDRKSPGLLASGAILQPVHIGWTPGLSG